MNIDFHFGIIYVVSRLAGMGPADAKTVAHACQYIDDSTTKGPLVFAEGQTFDRFATAHETFDYLNTIDSDSRLVWAPFHFLPGGEGTSFDKRVVCRKDSRIAREMVRGYLAAPRQDNSLHGLGVLLHTYVDTWAHQGFSGTESPHNAVHHFESENYTAADLTKKVESFIEAANSRLEGELIDLTVKVGHGAALHFPDLPWFKWRYRNGFDEEIERNNLPDFVDAAMMAYKVVKAFLVGETDIAGIDAMNEEHVARIEDVLKSNRSEDPNERLEQISHQLCSGKMDEIPEPLPAYVSKGPGSWKHLATGLSTIDDGHHAPSWSQEFEDSDYRKYHDAVKRHRMDVTTYLLPRFGIRLA